MQPGGSTVSSCLGRSSNTVSAATRTLCLCAVGFQFNPVTSSCIECIVALRQFKTNVGNEACRICTDERIYSAVTKTCSHPALTTQVVRLFHGINYVAFYVFNSNQNGTRITDIFQCNRDFRSVRWKTARLNTESPFQEHVLNTNTVTNLDFSSHTIFHHSRNVYMITIEFYDSSHYVECTYQGFRLRNFAVINLQMGSNNFIPVLYDSVSDNTKVLPIRVSSHCQGAPSMFCFRCLHFDQFSWIYRNPETGGLITDISSINAMGRGQELFLLHPDNLCS